MPSAHYQTRCAIGSSLRLTLCVCSLTFAGVHDAAAQQDEPLVEILAKLLAAEDARDFQEGLFGEAARHDASLVRRRAALAMGRIRDKAATEMLLDLLSDSEETVAVAAAFALGLLGDTTALLRLKDLVLRPRPAEQGAVESEAVAAVGRIGGEEAAQVFAEILGRGISRIGGDELSPVTERGLAEFWRLGDVAPADLIAAYAASPNPEIRWRVVYGLGRLQTSQAAGVLVGATTDSVARVRAAAVRAMTSQYGDSAGGRAEVFLSRVRLLTADPDPLVRIQALRALGTYAGAGEISNLADRLNDAHPNVRVAAVAALAELMSSAAAGVLEVHARNRSWALKRPALRGLAMISPPAAMPIISEMADSEDWRARLTAAEALAQAAPHLAQEILERLVQDTDPRVASAALNALIEVNPETGQLQSAALLSHEDPVVRMVAALYLGDVGGLKHLERLVDAFARAQADEWYGARVATVEALGRIAAQGVAERDAVVARLLARVPTADDYLARRAAEEHLPQMSDGWEDSTPIATGRGPGDYRDIVRRILLPAARGLKPVLVLETDQGELTIELQALDAPLSVDAILRLAVRRYFDGMIWHRVIPGFVIQSGDPRGDGWGGPGYTLRDELSPWSYTRGTVGLALAGPDTGGSQFFVTLGREPHLDGAYPVVGSIESGNDLLDVITLGDGIRRIARSQRAPGAAN